MKVLVCGSRDLADAWIVYVVLDGIHGHNQRVTELIEGQCPYGGADGFGEKWAKARREVMHLPFPADWDRHGKAAGPIRNQQMLDEGKPDMVLAFVNRPLAESRGTADMVRRARAAGVPTYVVEAVR